MKKAYGENYFVRRIISISSKMLVLLLVFVLSGCSGNSETVQLDKGVSLISESEENDVLSDAEDMKSGEDGIQSDDEHMEENSASDQAELTGYGQTFSEGYAWVGVEYDGTTRYACIDKTGTVRFAIPDIMGIQPTTFEDGYSYLVPTVAVEGEYEYGFEEEDGEEDEYEDEEIKIRTIGIVDTNGNLTKIGNEEDAGIVAYGGGFAVLERHQADFDSNVYIYEIYNAKGNLLDTIKLEDRIKVFYCGQSVFVFGSLSYFCGKTESWIDDWADDDDLFNGFPAGSMTKFVNGSDIAFICCTFIDSGMRLTFMTSEGEISSYMLPEISSKFSFTEMDFCTGGVSDQKYVFRDSYGCFFVYNLVLGSLTEMPKEYREKIDAAYYEDYLPYFNEGVCIMYAIGADDNSYFEVFDENWELQFDPIRTSLGKVYSGELITSGDSAYDKKGNLALYVDSGFLGPMRDGVFLHSNNNDFGSMSDMIEVSDTPYIRQIKASNGYISNSVKDYLDADGNPLFTTLDVSNVKDIDIGWVSDETD